MAWRKARIIDYALLSRRAPIRVGSFEFVLIVQHLAGSEAQTNEVNLYLVLVCDEIGEADVAFAERRERLL